MSGAREVLTERLARSHGQLRTVDEIVESLLPVVQRLMDEHAAAELEKAADHVESTHAALNVLGAGVTRLNDLLDVENDLRARAAALRAATGEATT